MEPIFDIQNLLFDDQHTIEESCLENIFLKALTSIFDIQNIFVGTVFCDFSLIVG